MHLLAIETSTQICAAAVVEEERLLAELRVNVKNIHSARLFSIIQAVFENASVEKNEIDAIAVSIGPGSFTGLRIGLSAAKGMAIGLNIPIIAVPTLDALASNAHMRDGLIYSMLQSRVDEYYTAVYARKNGKNEIIRDTLILTMDELIGDIPDGAYIMGHVDRLDESRILKRHCIIASPDANVLSAFQVAQIGVQKYRDNKIENISSLEPMYHQPFVAGKPQKAAL